jgi:DNA-binding HxlR family transcriptional regulator
MTNRPTLTAPYVCPIARSLEFIGERWTILIIRDLNKFGPRKFQDFEQGLTGIGSSTLSARLKKLEEAGIVERRFYQQHPPRAEYLLTATGKELVPVLKALFGWGERHTKYAPAAK